MRMMFCSKLGVNFPDPSGKICRLVEEYEESGGLQPANFSDQFERFIAEDAAVIPLYRSGLTWLINDQVPRTGLAKTMSVPRFDKMSFSQ